MNIIIREPKTKKEIEEYYNIRWRVLRKPHNQIRGSEKDDLEELAIHLIAYYGEWIPVAVGRAHFNSDVEVQVRFMAVDPHYQNFGLGSSILSALEKRVKTRGASYIILNSRESAVGFYKKNGYRITGKAGRIFGSIQHMKMRKDIVD